MAIHRALRTIFGDNPAAYSWVSRPNEAPPFDIADRPGERAESARPVLALEVNGDRAQLDCLPFPFSDHEATWVVATGRFEIEKD